MISTDRIIKGIEKEITELSKEEKRLRINKEKIETNLLQTKVKIHELVRLQNVCSKIKNDLVSQINKNE